MAAALATAACATASGAPGAPMFTGGSGAIVVAAGENFYGDILHQVGGDHVTVYAFISDPSADPHAFESNAGHARAVADARVVVENGLGYDAFMERLLRASPRADRKVINVQRLVGAPDGANPHLWYDPTVIPRVAEAAAGALASADPGHAEDYRANLRRFSESMQPLTDRIASLRDRFRGAPVALTEPVAAYLADALGLEVRSPGDFTKAVEEGNDPPAAATAAMQDLIKHHQVKALIYNRQAATRITARILDLARANAVAVVGVSETEPPGKAFQAWMLAELADLEAALAS